MPECGVISVSALAPASSSPGHWVGRVAPLLDRVLGIATLDALYRQHRLQGLPPFEFVTRALRALGITPVSPGGRITDHIPAHGPLLVVCNHPYGGIEALILAATIKTVRTDVKFLANAALGVFRELRPLLIPTHPLKVSQANLTSIRACADQLRRGGVLVVFPAGRVSYLQPRQHRTVDGDWHRMVGHLARTTGATVLPVFFHGTNSRLFHRLGRLFDHARLLMLPRELLKLRGCRIRYDLGRPLPAALWRHLPVRELTAYLRLMTYLLEGDDPEARASAPETVSPAPLAPYGSRARITDELRALPSRQRLLDFKQFSVFYATADQIPALMGDIGRERERVFRLHDEGSGNGRDTDAYDLSYVQLFAWDNAARTLVGAYRLGQTDMLRKCYGDQGNYLAQMFAFDAAFYAPEVATLELGRSFVVPEHQKSFHALYLLWQGIGRFLVAHPRYRRLYGTVSLSRQYDPRAIALLCDALIEPSPLVRPKHPLRLTLHDEWKTFRSDRGALDLQTLSACVRGLDAEGKDIPVLVRHYHKLGARFHCVGVDPNFNATAGLLLSVDVPGLSSKALSTFLGDGADSYLAYSRSTGPAAPVLSTRLLGPERGAACKH